MSKRRFGISISENVASELDKIAAKLGVDRSRIVEEAIRAYVSEYSHIYSKHLCRGIFIVISGRDRVKDHVDTVFEKYREIVVGLTHHHIAGDCVLMAIVQGGSENVIEMHRELVKCGCRVRYIPLPSEAVNEHSVK